MPASLTSDLLLLALDDRARYRTRGAPGVPLAAAELVEWVLAGRPVPALVHDPAESPGRRRRRLEALLRAERGPALDRVAGRLEHERAITPAEHRVLGLFPRRGYAVVDWRAREAAVRRLQDALRVGVLPGRGEAALAVLAAVAGIARSVAPAPSDRAGRRALADHLQRMQWLAGEPVAEVVATARRVLGRSGEPQDGLVPFVAHDPYADSGGDGGGWGDGGGGDGGGGDGGGGS